MSRGRQRRTPADEHARRIARAGAKGQPPPFTPELEQHCESAPREVFAAFAGLARHLPQAEEDESLALGYLVVLQRLLETLRLRADSGHAVAAELIAEFQSEVVRQIRAGEVDAGVLAAVGDVLHQSKIPASAELAALAIHHPMEGDDEEDGAPPDLYLDRIVAHQLALGLREGGVPPVGLLQIAETIGGAGWQPALMPIDTTLAELVADIPDTIRRPAAVRSILQRSDELADLELISQSWFEDSPEIARAIERAPGASGTKLATSLLRTVFARNRQKWADLVLHTALWMREASAADELCWPDLAIVAQALAEGHDMTEIGLMRDVALRTIGVQRDALPL